KFGDKMVGGIYEMEGPDFAQVPENWMPYLAVDDVDKRVKKATVAGATLMRPLFDIPGVGRIAILREPGGAGVGAGYGLSRRNGGGGRAPPRASSRTEFDHAA